MKIKIHPLFFVFWVIFALIGDTEFILYIFIAAAFHEAAHICAFTSYGAELDSIQLLPFGISATVKNAAVLSCKKEIICAAAGPITNLVLTAVTMLPKDIISGADTLAYCSFALFLINIMPSLPLDGGRILWFALLTFLPYKKAKKISDCTNIITTAALLTIGVVFAVQSGNISVLMIGGYLVIYIVFKS